ncbi:MAG: hypothetical protein ACJ70M_01370 [Nitrososphaera sp.]
MALAQVDSRDIEGDVRDIGDTVRDIFEEDEDEDDGGNIPLCREPAEVFVSLGGGNYICLNFNDGVLSDIGQDFP